MSCMETSSLSSRPRVQPTLAQRLPSPSLVTCLKLKPPTTPTRNYKLKSQIEQSPICLMSGKGRAQDEGAAWKAFGKAVEKFSNGQSIEDVLRHQMENKEYYVGGNGGKNPPRRGGGGSGGNGRDGSGGSGDEGFRNEAKQVILTTVGFLLLYIYIIRGEELTRLGRDYIRYLYGGHKTARLKNAMYSWERFWTGLREKVYDRKWLEKLVANTQSWYNSPEKYKRILGSHMASKTDDE